MSYADVESGRPQYQRRGSGAPFEVFKTACLSVRVPVPTVLRQAQAGFIHDASGRLAKLSAPTLVVHGAADEMIVAVNGEYLADVIPDAGLELRDGVGHLFWWERPDAAAELIRMHCLG